MKKVILCSVAVAIIFSGCSTMSIKYDVDSQNKYGYSIYYGEDSCYLPDFNNSGTDNAQNELENGDTQTVHANYILSQNVVSKKYLDYAKGNDFAHRTDQILMVSSSAAIVAGCLFGFLGMSPYYTGLENLLLPMMTVGFIGMPLFCIKDWFDHSRMNGNLKRSIDAYNDKANWDVKESPMPDDLRFSFAAMAGTKDGGINIPPFTDLGGNYIEGKTINSFDEIGQLALEKTYGANFNTPYFGLNFKLSGAHFDFPNSGKWLNFFAQHTYTSLSARGLNYGEDLKLDGYWWSFTPMLEIHYPIGDYLQLAGSIGMSAMGYFRSTIRDDYGVALDVHSCDDINNWNLLMSRFPDLTTNLDFALDLAFKFSRNDKNMYYLEAGRTVPAWNIGIRMEIPYTLDFLFDF